MPNPVDSQFLFHEAHVQGSQSDAYGAVTFLQIQQITCAITGTRICLRCFDEIDCHFLVKDIITGKPLQQPLPTYPFSKQAKQPLSVPAICRQKRFWVYCQRFLPGSDRRCCPGFLPFPPVLPASFFSGGAGYTVRDRSGCRTAARRLR